MLLDLRSQFERRGGGTYVGTVTCRTSVAATYSKTKTPAVQVSVFSTVTATYSKIKKPAVRTSVFSTIATTHAKTKTPDNAFALGFSDVSAAYSKTKTPVSSVFATTTITATYAFVAASGARTYTYVGTVRSQSRVQAVTSGPHAVPDDRSGSFRLRRHAHVRIDTVAPVSVSAANVRAVRTGIAAPTAGFPVHVASGSVAVYTDVSLAAQTGVAGAGVRLASGVVHVRSDARVEVQSAGIGVQTSSPASVSTSSMAVVQGQRVRSSAGRVTVEIGPDLVQMEDDELFFLLDVA